MHLDSNEIQVRLSRQSFSNHGLGAAWWTIEQMTTRRTTTKSSEQLWVTNRPDYTLLELQFQVTHTTDVTPEDLQKSLEIHAQNSTTISASSVEAFHKKNGDTHRKVLFKWPRVGQFLTVNS